MKFPENLSQEFKIELFKAIRLSALLTALVLGFVLLQNRVSTPEEVISSGTARTKGPKCVVDRKGNRVPASLSNETDRLVDCER